MIGVVSSGNSHAANRESDPLIDEVRRIRREICERTGHDLDRLAEELRQVEREYAQRDGVFAGVSTEAAARVQASWGDMSGPGEDPIVEEVRSARQASRQRNIKE
jgi:hypothetical protein